MSGKNKKTTTAISKKFNPPLVVNPNKDLFRWKVDAYPSLIYAVCCDMTKSPYGWPKSEGFFFGHDFYWFDDWSVIWTHGDKFIKKYLQSSRGELPAKFKLKCDTEFARLIKEVRRIAKIDLAKLSLSELRREWFRFFKAYAHFWLVITDIEVLNYTASHRLEKIVKRKKIPLNPEELSQLSAFPGKSYMLAEEFDLLKIALEKSQGQREHLLERHLADYSWLLNGYHGVRLADRKFFTGRLAKLTKDQATPKNFLHLKNYHRELTAQFNSLVKKYKLDAEVIKYAKLAQVSSYIQDKRKALSWQATDHIVALYRALAKFSQISLEESLYILWDEFDRALKDPRFKREIAKRQVCSRLRILGDRTTILTKQTREIFVIFDKKYLAASGPEIKGAVAYPGLVTGRVQVITSGQEINNFKNGRILVALMTSPDYVVAMKKAKAIITDDGGLTCHAAIVARELKKPCIVGTRNATRWLKDGDLVEVDANQGTVKLLKK